MSLADEVLKKKKELEESVEALPELPLHPKVVNAYPPVPKKFAMPVSSALHQFPNMYARDGLLYDGVLGHSAPIDPRDTSGVAILVQDTLTPQSAAVIYSILVRLVPKFSASRVAITPDLFYDIETGRLEHGHLRTISPWPGDTNTKYMRV